MDQPPFDRLLAQLSRSPEQWRVIARRFCGTVLVLLAYTLVVWTYAVARYKITGDIIDGFSPKDMKVSAAAQTLLGVVLLGGAAGAGFTAAKNPAERGVTASAAASVEAAAAVRRRAAERARAEEEELLGRLRADPQLHAIEILLGRLLQDYHSRAERADIARESKAFRREVGFLVLGTILGAFAPLAVGPFLGLIAR